MTEVARAVERLLTHVQETRDILRETTPLRFTAAPWPITLRLNLLEASLRQKRRNRSLPPLRDIEEALGLLAMLRHLNYEGWADQVYDIWPHLPRDQVKCYGVGNDHERFGVSLLIEEDHGFAQPQHCHEQCQAKEPSAKYQQVLLVVQGLNRDRIDPQSPKTSVHLLLFHRHQRPPLQALMETSRMYRWDVAAPIFCITHACFIQADMNLGVQELKQITALQEDGLVVYPFRLASCQLPQAQSRPQLLKVLQQLFAVSADIQRETLGVKHLTVSNSTPSYWIPALLSAAHSSKSLKSIQVESTCVELRETTATRFHLADAAISASDADNVFISPLPLTVRVVEDSVGGARSARVLLPGIWRSLGRSGEPLGYGAGAYTNSRRRNA